MDRLNRLADLLDNKYQLTVRADDRSLSQRVLDAKRELTHFLNLYIHGNKKPGVGGTASQDVMYFARAGFPPAEEYLKLWNSLGDPKNPENNDPNSLLKRMYRAALVGHQMSSGAGKYIDQMKDQVSLNNPMLKDLAVRKQKLHVQANILGNVLQRLGTEIKQKVPGFILSFPDPPERVRRDLNKDEINRFIQRHPVAAQYGLTPEILSELLQSPKGLMYFPKEREKLITFINAANSGKDPKGGPELFKKIQEIRERLAAEQREPNEITDDFEERARHIYTDPAEQVSREMLAQKELKQQERAEEAEHQESMQRLQPQIEDAERRQKEELERKKKEEEALVSKYSQLTFTQWLRS